MRNVLSNSMQLFRFHTHKSNATSWLIPELIPQLNAQMNEKAGLIETPEQCEESLISRR